MRRTACLVVLLLAGSVLPLHAQEAEKKPGDVMIQKYLDAGADRLSRNFLDGAESLEEWQQKRPRLYREYMDMLGLWPLPEKTPLHATFTGSTEHEGVVIDNLHFQSKPGLYVTANLYRPRGTEQSPKSGDRKYPAVVYVCGHSNKGRDGNKTAFQDHGIWFARHGYICIMLDTLQLGEIPGVHHGTYGRPYNHLAAYGVKDKDKGEVRWWWHSAGYTPAGVECWNGVRAIDYLVSRPDVDAAKITVTGISGGGAATFWIAAADDRVACAVPVSGMSDLHSYVKDKVINGHCDCMFLYNAHQWDWTTIAALVAPRPLLFANSDNDRIFPMDGNRRIIEKLRKLYKMYGRPGLVDEYVSEGGHAYRPDLRQAVFGWIEKHIRGNTGPAEDSADYKELPGEKLRVFPTDADIPADQINTKIDESFVPKAKVALPDKGDFAEWKNILMKGLREKVFRANPGDVPAARPFEGLRFPALTTDEGVHVHSYLLSGNLNEAKSATLLVDLGEEIDPRALAKSLPESVADRVKGGAVFAFWPRGAGPAQAFAWTAKSPPNYVERSHALLGRTVDEGRVRDVVSAVKAGVAASGGKHRWKVMGVGRAGVIAAYAALFEPKIEEVVVVRPPNSHKDGPHFLNVLRVLDVPEALGLLAPRRLTLVTDDDALYNRVADIYRRAGAADQLTRK